LMLSGPLVARYGVAGGGAAFVLAQALQLGISYALSLFVFPMPWHRPLLAIRLLRRGMRR
jgi:hypothetical protein